MGKKIFGYNYLATLRQGFYFVWPGIVKLFKIPFMDRSVTSFMRKVFWEILQERESNNYKRNDLIDTLIHIRKTWVEDSIKYEGDRVVAQAGQFFSASFETISGAISFALYELCLNKDIQNRVRSEVLSVLTNDDSFTFDKINNMKYLQAIVYETLRKYPVFLFNDRMCLEDYKIPNGNLVIEKGTPLCIPVLGLHHDSKYFPNPEEFNPERFAEENNVTSNFFYLPFGKGPRICLGERFALLVTKLCLAHILSKFEIEKSEDTPVPLKYRTTGIVLASTVGLPMRFKKIEKKLYYNDKLV
ncbi:hypothetical protein ILUMI_26863 [Ignelater luminosus]|uniref:Cytochrome P450 n=1 Tax=Ignelater luminosus TaxID=2038154 RepID=A0A8K0C3Z2_IGNLU|nr:hypothetical protein ILUMI_26863 [Ignelater luminosus]